MSPRMRPVWTPDDVVQYCKSRVTTSVDVTAEILGMSRGAVYDSIKRGVFPIEVVKLSGRRWLVPTAEIVRVLGLEDRAEAEA